jgi:hypothetical protein
VWRIVVALLAGLIAVAVAALGSFGAQPTPPDLGESVVIVPDVADPDARRDDGATELVTEDDTSSGGSGNGDGDDPPATDGKASWITRVGDTAPSDPVGDPATVPSRQGSADAPSRDTVVTAPSRDSTGD